MTWSAPTFLIFASPGVGPTYLSTSGFEFLLYKDKEGTVPLSVAPIAFAGGPHSYYPQGTLGNVKKTILNLNSVTTEHRRKELGRRVALAYTKFDSS